MHFHRLGVPPLSPNGSRQYAWLSLLPEDLLQERLQIPGRSGNAQERPPDI